MTMEKARNGIGNKAYSVDVEKDFEDEAVPMPFSRYQNRNSNRHEPYEMEDDFQVPGCSVTKRGDSPDINTSSRFSRGRGHFSTRFGFRQRFTRYCTSQKGHELTVALSAMTVLVLTMVGLALMLSHAFGAASVTKVIIDRFFITMYSLSTVAMLGLVILGVLDLLTNDDLYRDQTETNFLRGGVICLGTGGIIYHAVSLISHALVSDECRDWWGVGLSSVAIVFIVFQITFIIKYSKVRINKTVWLSVSSRSLIAMVVATNVCIWVRTVISESTEEIESNGNGHDQHSGQDHATASWIQDAFRSHIDGNEETYGSRTWSSYNNTSCPNCTECDLYLKHIVQPYTWPLLIEFCVLASTLLVAIWEKCGHGLETPEETSRRRHLSSLNSGDMLDLGKRDNSLSQTNLASLEDSPRDSPKKRYYNNQYGFVIGWVMICCTVVLIIVYLYYSNVGDNSDGNDSLMTLAIYSFDTALSLICLITVPVAIIKMRTLTFRDDEIKRIKEVRNAFSSTGREIKRKGKLQRSIDRQLLGFTNLALMAFHVMTMIAALDNDNDIVFINGLASVIMACTQTVFINWYAMQKRSTTEENLTSKPGRQCLEILRCGNFALWLVNTFLVRHPGAKHIQNITFGVTAWAAVSNLFLPLLILYHFHAGCCLAEVINHSYSVEYIGLIRPSKLARNMAMNEASPDELQAQKQRLRSKSYSDPNIYAQTQLVDVEEFRRQILDSDHKETSWEISHM